MHTTSQSVNKNKLSRAIDALETLSSPAGSLILEALQEHFAATFLELALFTGLSSAVLEEQLEILCGAGIIMERETEGERCFTLDRPRLMRTMAAASNLSRGVR